MFNMSIPWWELIVRSLLVPATVALMDRWNWWAPKSLTRFLGLGARG